MYDKILVKASICYADEFDLEVFGTFALKEWNELRAKTKKAFKDYGQSVEHCFGTNEAVEFNNFKDWDRHFKVTEISDDEYQFLKDNFGETWGTGSDVFEIANNIREMIGYNSSE